jgi:predicted amidohydrolase
MTQRFVAGLVQMTAGTEIDENVKVASQLIREARGRGAQLVVTPENTTQIEPDKARVLAETQPEATHPAIPPFRALAQELNVWLLIGSLTVKASDAKCWNRSYLFAPDGSIAARYDKIHMFDVQVGDGQSYRESSTFEPGRQAVMADLPWARLGLTICYDIRFPYLYRALAQGGAEILTAPAAFTEVTGQAHWHVLQRARAIETGCYLLSAAQCGTHARGRRTFGHSVIVAPWGEVLADGGTEPGVVTHEIDLAAVASARHRIPALTHDRAVEAPVVANALKLAGE